MKKSLVFSLVFIISLGVTYAQTEKKSAIPLIGSEAPSFTAETTDGTLNFPADFGRSWKVLLSHPRDYTPVCTSEILELAKLEDQLDELNVKVAVLSTDNVELHQMWKNTMNEILSKEPVPAKITFPLVGDEFAEISRLYGMLHEPISTTKDVRGVFVINPDNIVEATYFYPLTVGRNLNEIIRTVQALQTTHASSYLTPANWEPGEDLIVPHFPYTEEQLKENKDIADEYYSVNSFLWFKKCNK